MINRLKELRVEKGFTQKEIAAKLNLTQQTYSDYETGRTDPDMETLVLMGDILEVSIDYLLNRSDETGVINVFHQTDKMESLSAAEQKLIALLRKKPPLNATDWISLYADLPHHLQENIFAELKGMHLACTASKIKKEKSL